MTQYVSRVLQKVFPISDNIFQSDLTAKMCKKFNSQDNFLRADQGRAKHCCQIGWIGCPIMQVCTQKATAKKIVERIFVVTSDALKIEPATEVKHY